MKFTIIKVQTGKTIIPIKFKLKCIYQFIKNISKKYISPEISRVRLSIENSQKHYNAIHT